MSLLLRDPSVPTTLLCWPLRSLAAQPHHLARVISREWRP